jgi:type IV secretory pathway TraG/TraD family ATPase VirD4
MVFLANMMGATKSQSSSGDRYWIESAAGVLAGVIWRLRSDYPQNCDLPHAIAIVINKPVEELTEFLKRNDQSVFLAASYFKSLVSEKQVAGILGTLASSLSKVALPEIFYLLSGNEVDLELNHPDHPTMLTLSTIQQLDKTYAPVLALIISMSLKMMNQEGRHHSAIVLDEAPTLIVPEFDRIPATARSNKIATFFIAQDMVQGEDGYGRIGRDKILATLSTHLYGKVTDPATAERYSRMFGTVDKYYTSKSRKAGAWSNSGYTDSLREIRKYKPEKFHQLETGEFLGVIAEGNMKEFNARFTCYQEKTTQLPMVRNITTYEVDQAFKQIIEESKILT